ncbi:aldehyde dehydrogenase family protein [Nocardia sp. CA-107356]|uniref:aldehyde dehydrogenase family protein n=1 Tax=Nocardia sp. CA-107356 TaxID=3239972 RepID=UPI003D8E2D2E
MNSRAPNAIAVARTAQDAWGAMSVGERVTALAQLPRAIIRHADRITEVIGRENGKPRAEALGHEVASAVAVARYYLEHAEEVLAARRIRQKTSPLRSAVATYRPHGVVLAIAPWNLPFIIPFSQVLPALLAGNAVVLKPSELTPGTGQLVGDIINAVGLPPGVCQVVTGDGQVAAELLSSRPDKVLFTGSVATGRAVMTAAAQFPIPVTLELGGVDAAIVCEDADVEFTASAIAWGATFNGGQACCSIERLIVAEPIADQLLTRIEAKLAMIDTEADLAPPINARQQNTWRAHLSQATASGLRVLPPPDPASSVVSPALVTGGDLPTSEDLCATAVWREETFGPVVVATTFTTLDEAVALHNDTRFGLTASVFSGDVTAARRVAERLKAGVVSINDVAAILYSAPEIPWGGVGESGFGRAHGPEALIDASWLHTVEYPAVGAFGPKRPWWYPYGPELESFFEALLPLADARTTLSGLTKTPRIGSAAARMLARFSKN